MEKENAAAKNVMPICKEFQTRLADINGILKDNKEKISRLRLRLTNNKQREAEGRQRCKTARSEAAGKQGQEYINALQDALAKCFGLVDDVTFIQNEIKSTLASLQSDGQKADQSRDSETSQASSRPAAGTAAAAQEEGLLGIMSGAECRARGGVPDSAITSRDAPDPPRPCRRPGTGAASALPPPKNPEPSARPSEQHASGQQQAATPRPFVSCAVVADKLGKDDPAVEHCKYAYAILRGARAIRETYPLVSQEDYKRAAKEFAEAGDTVRERWALEEANSPTLKADLAPVPVPTESESDMYKREARFFLRAAKAAIDEAGRELLKKPRDWKEIIGLCSNAEDRYRDAADSYAKAKDPDARKETLEHADGMKETCAKMQEEYDSLLAAARKKEQECRMLKRDWDEAKRRNDHTELRANLRFRLAGCST